MAHEMGGQDDEGYRQAEFNFVDPLFGALTPEQTALRARRIREHLKRLGQVETPSEVRGLPMTWLNDAEVKARAAEVKKILRMRPQDFPTPEALAAQAVREELDALSSVIEHPDTSLSPRFEPEWTVEKILPPQGEEGSEADQV